MKKIVLTAVTLALVLAAVPAGRALAVWSPVDWSTVEGEIGADSQKGENLDVGAGYDLSVPATTMNALVGKDTTLAVHTGDGIAVGLSGKEIQAGNQDLKLTLMRVGNSIPESVSREILSNAYYNRSFAMEEKGAYAVPLSIHFNLNRAYAGKYANLYHYDEEIGKMVFDGSFVITDRGMAMFPLERGDEYILTVTDSLPVGGRIGYTVQHGDCLSRIASKNGVSLRALLAANPTIQDADLIRPGQTIMIVK